MKTLLSKPGQFVLALLILLSVLVAPAATSALAERNHTDDYDWSGRRNCMNGYDWSDGHSCPGGYDWSDGD